MKYLVEPDIRERVAYCFGCTCDSDGNGNCACRGGSTNKDSNNTSQS